MAVRLSLKNRKRRRDQKSAYKAGNGPKCHKVAEERSKKANKKKAFRMY